jgi:hypothetical protein
MQSKFSCKVNSHDCCGTLIKSNKIEVVPSLFHVNAWIKSKIRDDKLLTIHE